MFVYGGCKGNGNNFVSEVQCLQKCGDESDLALLPQVEITTEIGELKNHRVPSIFQKLAYHLDFARNVQFGNLRTSQKRNFDHLACHEFDFWQFLKFTSC